MIKVEIEMNRNGIVDNKWIDLQNLTYDEFLEEIECEEYTIKNYGFGSTFSKPTVQELIELAPLVEDYSIPIDVLLEIKDDIGNDDVKDTLDDYYLATVFDVDSYFQDLAWERFDEIIDGIDTYEHKFFKMYFDYKALARDLRHDYNIYESKLNNNSYIFIGITI